jgi:drug/metabolite transporter (DMT)-like permease
MAAPARWKIVVNFAIIYFVWGSTFLAIRVGVREVPPFLLAGMRFFAAGLALCLWTLVRREPLPTARQVRSAVLLALPLFVLDYGLLFWAEQRVPSGIAAVILATIPVFMAICEIVFLRTQKLTPLLAISLVIGLAGVAVLVSRSMNLGGAPVDHKGAIALIVAAASWAMASLATPRLDLPASKVMSSGAQMLAGGIMLGVTAAALGELRGFDARAVSRVAWLSLAYLVVAGSIVAFTAYVWLLHHESPTKVGTYAYVNPVVAVLVGHFLGDEPLGIRAALGTALVLASVLLITTAGWKNKMLASPVEEAG